eukprot:s123_g40.t1
MQSYTRFSFGWKASIGRRVPCPPRTDLHFSSTFPHATRKPYSTPCSRRARLLPVQSFQASGCQDFNRWADEASGNGFCSACRKCHQMLRWKWSTVWQLQLVEDLCSGNGA